MDPTAAIYEIATQVPGLAVLAWLVKVFLKDRREQNERCHAVTTSATKALVDNTAILHTLHERLDRERDHALYPGIAAG